MRWVAYRTADNPAARMGVVVGEQIRGTERTRRLLDLLADTATLGQAGEEAISRPSEVVELDKAILLSPIDVPPSIRDFMAFEEHVVTGMRKAGRVMDPLWYEDPAFYFSNPAAVRGPYDDIPVPPGSNMFDFELELCAVIGAPGENLTPAEAERHIAGYMILCDWSARDLQFREIVHGLGPVKGKDTATTLGPALVTPDELEDVRAGLGYDLQMTATINGMCVSQGNWKDIYWSFGEMISYASRGTEVRAGDIFGSGTVGTGCLFETIDEPGGFGRYLRPGDQLVIEVERLGSIANTVVPGQVVHPLPPRQRHS